MHIKSIVAAAAIALAAGIGSAGAGEDFTVLRGLEASPMSNLETTQTRGAADLNRALNRGGVNEVPIDLGALLPVISVAISDSGGGVVNINGVITVTP